MFLNLIIPQFMRVGLRVPWCALRIHTPTLVRDCQTCLPAAMGEGAFFSPGITAIKLLDIEFPNGYLSSFSGPRFGTEGIRNILV